MADGKVTILYLASNAIQNERLDLDQEIERITDKLRGSEHRDVLDIRSLWSVELDRIIQALNERKPAIVHFSGHGTQAGEIILSDADRQPKPVSADVLEALFKAMKDRIRLVFLNACYSEKQAAAISKVIDCVIGINDSISDDAAIAFAASFYRAIGFGRSVRQAFDQGKVTLMDRARSEEETLKLLVRDGVDASSVVLVDTSRSELGNASVGSKTPSDPAKIIDIQTAFFNRITEALWEWRYSVIQVAYYGAQEDPEKLVNVAEAYDTGTWKAFPAIRLEISRSQRYLSHETYLVLRNLYTFIVEVDKVVTGLIFSVARDSAQNPKRKRLFSELNMYIYSEVTNTIEAAIGSVAAELHIEPNGSGNRDRRVRR